MTQASNGADKAGKSYKTPAVKILLIALGLLAIAAALGAFGSPGKQIQAEAQQAASIMKQARNKAIADQSPVRVVIHCREHGKNQLPPCYVSIETAQFTIDNSPDRDSPVHVTWSEVAGTRHQMDADITVLSVDSPGGGNIIPNDIFWLVFMPDGAVRTFSEPCSLVFVSEAANRALNNKAWEMNVSNATGRVNLLQRK